MMVPIQLSRTEHMLNDLSSCYTPLKQPSGLPTVDFVQSVEVI